MVTLDDVRKGVMAKIDSFKEASTPIYGEEIPQKFKEPSFYVKVIRTRHNQQLNEMYKRRHLFDIHYFPKPGNNVNEQILVMAERLYEELEYIEVNGKLTRGVEMHHEAIDNVLHFFVNYNFTVKKQVEELLAMENLYQKGVLKVDRKEENQK